MSDAPGTVPDESRSVEGRVAETSPQDDLQKRLIGDLKELEERREEKRGEFQRTRDKTRELEEEFHELTAQIEAMYAAIEAYDRNRYEWKHRPSRQKERERP